MASGISTYRPGSWTAVVADGFVALLGGVPDSATVDELWQLAQRGAGVVEALAVVSRAGLVGLPPFALATRDASGRVQVALRGGVRLRLDEAGGTRWVGAGEVSTWSERVLPAGADLHLRVEGEGASGSEHPLVAGVVPAGEVRCPGAAAAAREPEPVATADPPGAEPTLARLRLAVAHEGDPADAAVATGAGPVHETAAVSERTVPVSRQERLRRAAGAREPGPVAAGDAPQRQQAAWAGAAAAAGPARSARSTLAGDVSTTIASGQLAYLRDRLPVWGNDSLRRPEPPAQPPARLVLSTGLVVALDRPVVLGRAPQATRVASAELPRLVSLPSPQHDISRTHAEVRLDDGDVLVTDLDSTNGVLVQRPGRGSRRLRAGEPVVLHEGETVDLGDGITFVVERGT